MLYVHVLCIVQDCTMLHKPTVLYLSLRGHPRKCLTQCVKEVLCQTETWRQQRGLAGPAIEREDLLFCVSRFYLIQ